MPTIPKNYEEARRLADQARNKAYECRERAERRETYHRAYQRAGLREYWWQFWRPATLPLTIPFETAVDRRVSNDPDYKGAVADNQLYIQYATMYAQREILAALRENDRELDVYLDLNDYDKDELTSADLPRRVPNGWTE